MLRHADRVWTPLYFSPVSWKTWDKHTKESIIPQWKLTSLSDTTWNLQANTAGFGRIVCHCKTTYAYWVHVDSDLSGGLALTDALLRKQVAKKHQLIRNPLVSSYNTDGLVPRWEVASQERASSMEIRAYREEFCIRDEWLSHKKQRELTEGHNPATRSYEQEDQTTSAEHKCIIKHVAKQLPKWRGDLGRKSLGMLTYCPNYCQASKSHTVWHFYLAGQVPSFVDLTVSSS